MKDQAEHLRRKMHTLSLVPAVKKTSVITVSSGKGGVGKSNFSVNFALSLIRQNKKVVIVDLDLGLANIDVLMGRSPRKNLLDLIQNKCELKEVLMEGPGGLFFIAGGSGFQYLLQHSADDFATFFQELDHLHSWADYLILDTGAGLSEQTLQFILAADEAIIVTTPEPTALTDAYAVLKMVHAHDQRKHMQLVINRCTFGKEGQQTAAKLQLVADQFLNKKVDYLGDIPDDESVSQAVKKQIPFLLAYPRSKASLAMQNLTNRYLQVPGEQARGIRSFFSKMLQFKDGM